MKRTYLTICLAFAFALVARAKANTPPLLVGAAHCLVTKHQLHATQNKSYTLGYFLDAKSYPGDKVMYVVEFNNVDKNIGAVFVIFLSKQNEAQVFDIQNNANFIINTHGISFPNPPLGGIWTHEHIISAIKVIEKGQRFVVPAHSTSIVSSGIACKSYTDSL